MHVDSDVVWSGKARVFLSFDMITTNNAHFLARFTLNNSLFRIGYLSLKQACSEPQILLTNLCA